MKCPSCGRENPHGEQYCLDCGQDLTAAPAAPTAATAAAISDEEFQQMLASPPAPESAAHTDATVDAVGGGQARSPMAPAPPADTTPVPAPSGGDVAPAPAAAIPSVPAAPPSGPAVSFDIAGPAAASTVAFSAHEARVGRRDADAGIYPEIDFEGNDVVVDRGERVHAVSRRHGRVLMDGGTLSYEDLGSTNGSTIDGAAVLPNDPRPLRDGSVIVLGRTCRITVHVR